MNVVHNLKKRPSDKYLAKRRISFAAQGEVDHIRDGDTVNITIVTKTGETRLSMEGKEFLRKLEDRTAKSSGTKIFVLEF